MIPAQMENNVLTRLSQPGCNVCFRPEESRQCVLDSFTMQRAQTYAVGALRPALPSLSVRLFHSGRLWRHKVVLADIDPIPCSSLLPSSKKVGLWSTHVPPMQRYD